MKRGKYRKAVFIVTYARVQSKIKGKDKIYYLLLKRKLHWKGWEFPKGGIGVFETKKRAIKREIKEETGLLNKDIIRIKKFNVNGKYDYPKEFSDRKGVIGQTYTLYAVEIPKKKVKINRIEHSSYKWLRFNQAMKKLTHANQRKCLRVVDKFLNK